MRKNFVKAAVATAGVTLTLLAAPVGAQAASAQTATAQTAAVTTAVKAAPDYSRIFCRYRIVKNFIPACSHGRWELKQIKIMRCVAGKMHYVAPSPLGMARFALVVTRCATGGWREW